MSTRSASSSIEASTFVISVVDPYLYLFLSISISIDISIDIRVSRLEALLLFHGPQEAVGETFPHVEYFIFLPRGRPHQRDGTNDTPLELSSIYIYIYRSSDTANTVGSGAIG
jgi:hypothetical protein